MARVGILQHFWCEPAVVFEESLRQAGHQTTNIELFNGAAVPRADDFDAWLIMGGPMNVDETDKYPCFVPEKRLIAELIEADRPVMGICLGAQLIARAAGARVYPRRPKEIGLFNVQMTPAAADDPLFSLFEPVQEVFQWHGDTFDLPAGAVLLASSPRYSHQAFRLGKRVYALQFHIEADLRIARQWRDQWTEELAQLPAEDRFEQFEPRLEAALARQNNLARRFVGRWTEMFY